MTQRRNRSAGTRHPSPRSGDLPEVPSVTAASPVKLVEPQPAVETPEEEAIRKMVEAAYT